MFKIRLSVYILAFVLLVAVRSLNLYADAPIFGGRIDKGTIEFKSIDEASGIADSRLNVNVLWTHNDSGDKNRIFALNTSGRHLGEFLIDGVKNRDWEDIAVGPGPIDSLHYIYIGEIGDNSAQYDLKYIYRVPEPVVYTNQAAAEATIFGVETITFQYPDGNRDAETLMVDPLTKDLYVVSKTESNLNVYRASYPQSTIETITLEHVASLNFTGAVGGDISPSGLEILIKTYSNIYYWERTPGQTLWQAFENKRITVPYIREPQGEAVCWQADGMGYYTISEEPLGIPAHLYFYPRLNPSLVDQGSPVPTIFKLEQNFPNPFNPTTTIQYTLSTASHVTLKIYDLLGREVAKLVDEYKLPGNYRSEYYAGSLESGVYYYKIQVGDSGRMGHVRKFVLLK